MAKKIVWKKKIGSTDEIRRKYDASETALKSQTARYFSADILVIEQSRHCRKTKYSLKISEIPPTFQRSTRNKLGSAILPACI